MYHLFCWISGSGNAWKKADRRCTGFEKVPDRVMVVHGEDTVTDHFAALVEEQFGCPAFAPYSGGSVDLATNEIITIGQKIPKKAEEKPNKIKSSI